MTTITRSSDHLYTYNGVTYPGVTGILKILDKSGPLMGWAARQTAEAAVKLWNELPTMLDTVGPEGVVKALTARSNWTNDQAKDLGTNVHEQADRINRGEPTGSMTVTEALYVEHYRKWLEASGWDVKISEAYLVNELGYGGTLDILARDRDGRSVLADLKTGKGVYRESVLQIAAYGMATLIQPVVHESVIPRVFTMPTIDRYAILHVTAKGVREIEVPIGTEDQQAFYACMALSKWSEGQKGRAL